MNELNQLVFFGEILPGHDVDVVKAKLGELLKLPNEQIASVFSGRKIVLRKGLSSEQAASYVARLEKVGVQVFAEPMPAPAPLEASAPRKEAAETPAPAAVPVATPVPAPESAPIVAEAAAAPAAVGLHAVVLEEMDCPKCGERQPKRTLCRACSVDMKRFAEAQVEAEQAAKEERMLAREIAMIERGQGGGPRVRVSSEEGPGLMGFGFAGRTGRINYWIGGFPIAALIALSLWFGMKTGSLAICVIGLVVGGFMMFRLTALRCHDINWSGLLCLILWIPYVGVLFGLLLGFWPGTKGDNAHGAPNRIVGVPAALGMLIAFGVSIALVTSQAEALVKTYLMASSGKGFSKPGNEKVLTVAEADVEMFTTSSCGVCHMAKAYMNQRGITYAEKDVEKNEEYLREFYARGGRGVPYIFVGNQSMSGFDADRLEQMLRASHRM